MEPDAFATGVGNKQLNWSNFSRNVMRERRSATRCSTGASARLYKKASSVGRAEVVFAIAVLARMRLMTKIPRITNGMGPSD
jgi:hypothetical protein